MLRKHISTFSLKRDRTISRTAWNSKFIFKQVATKYLKFSSLYNQFIKSNFCGILSGIYRRSIYFNL